LIAELQSKLTAAEEQRVKVSLLFATATKEKHELKKELKLKEQHLDLYVNAHSNTVEINGELRDQLEISQQNVRHLSESYIDTLTRIEFLQARNKFYYSHYHSLIWENTETELSIDEFHPPSLGPL
jgi:uncharacterized protein YaaW (UPF0174 family)